MRSNLQRNQFTNDSSNAISLIATQGFLFVTCYAISFIFVLVMFILNIVDGAGVSTGKYYIVQFCMSICYPSQGLLNAIVYIRPRILLWKHKIFTKQNGYNSIWKSWYSACYMGIVTRKPIPHIRRRPKQQQQQQQGQQQLEENDNPDVRTTTIDESSLVENNLLTTSSTFPPLSSSSATMKPGDEYEVRGGSKINQNRVIADDIEVGDTYASCSTVVA